MATPDAPASRIERRRQRFVMFGILLTFVGLVLLGFSLPTAPATLAQVLPWAAAGLLALWIGGILLGNVIRPIWRRRE